MGGGGGGPNLGKGKGPDPKYSADKEPRLSFNGENVCVIRGGKTLKLVREEQKEIRKDPELKTSTEEITTKDFVIVDGKKIPIIGLRVEDGDKIIVKDKSTATIGDGDAIKGHAAIITVHENSEISLRTDGKKFITDIEALRGIFVFDIDSVNFKGAIKTKSVKISPSERAAQAILYVEATDDATYIWFRMPFAAKIINTTTKEVMEPSFYEAIGLLVIARSDGFYQRDCRKFPDGMPPRLLAAKKRVEAMWQIPTLPPYIRNLKNSLNNPLTPERMRIEAEIERLKMEAKKPWIQKYPDEIEKLEDEIETLKKSRDQVIQFEKEAQRELEEKSPGIKKMIEDAKNRLKKQETLLDTPLPKYKPVTRKEKWTPRPITKTVPGMDEVSRLEAERIKALSLAGLSEKARKAIESTFELKQQQVAEEMAKDAIAKSKGVGHLTAYTAKKDLHKKVNYNDLEINLQYAEKGPELYGYERKVGQDYLLVGLEIRNPTEEPKFFLSERELRLSTESGKEKQVLWFKAEESYAPQSTHKGFMVFSVPVNDKSFTIKFGAPKSKGVSARINLT